MFCYITKQYTVVSMEGIGKTKLELGGHVWSDSAENELVSITDNYQFILLENTVTHSYRFTA